MKSDGPIHAHLTPEGQWSEIQHFKTVYNLIEKDLSNDLKQKLFAIQGVAHNLNTMQEIDVLLNAINIALIIPIITYSILLEKKELDLTGKQLTRIPEQILTDPNYQKFWTKLKRFICASNQLRTIPESISVCVKLEYFSCHSNILAYLPQSLSELNIEHFICCRNQLRSLPHFKPSLKWLLCHENQLESLPENLGQCINLREIFCSDNKLQCLPEGFEQCNDLKGAYFSRNALRSLPKGLVQQLGTQWEKEILYKQNISSYEYYVTPALTWGFNHLINGLNEMAENSIGNEEEQYNTILYKSGFMY